MRSYFTTFSLDTVPTLCVCLVRNLFSCEEMSSTSTAKNHCLLQTSYTNAMTLSKLSTRSLEMDYLEEELKSIPSNMPKMATLPDGVYAKNRYANVIPRKTIL